MSALAYRRFLEVTRVQIRSFQWVSVLAATVLVAVTPIIFGVKNLDSTASSFILERFVALIGILLFTPLFSPESDKNIGELVESKYTSPNLVYLSRLLVSFLALLLLVAVSIMVMRLNNCSFNMVQFGFGTAASALFLGALGFTAYAVSGNIIVGYMLPIAFYMLNMFQGGKMKMLYLFSLSKGSTVEKNWLLLLAAAILLVGILFRHWVRKLR